ncbi:MarR family winged helix-turn-helix transcriptional regulator [Ancylobacter terrae]|uniref:MarR family winged helix-turn-helix transcriptional regulator n=1 Tax=Ancylobacter sp. sgz301288 TaxID=3342077 RepID=UPI00385D6B6B
MPAEAPPAPSPLTAHLGYWLRLVSNHVSHAFARQIEARGVTVAEWVLLRELHDAEALSPSRLAARLGLTRGAVTKLADRLIAKELLARHANRDDARAQFLSLTPAGRALVPDLAAAADSNDAAFFGHLGEAERRRLEATLRALVDHHALPGTPID